MDIPKHILPFFNAAKKLVDAGEDAKSCARAGQAFSSVIYQLPDPSIVIPYVLDYLEGHNKTKWHAAIPVAASIFAAVDFQIIKTTGEKNPDSFAHSLLAARQNALNSVYFILVERLVELRSIYHEPEREMQGDAAMYVPLLNFALGAALRAFGVRAVLDLKPMAILEHELREPQWGTVTRSWWIRLIQRHARRCDSNWFVTHILPVIVGLQNRIAEKKADFAANGSISIEASEIAVEVKKTSIIVQQLWSILPSLMSTAIDLDIAFKHSALPQVIMAGLEDPEVTEYVLRSLRLAAVHAASILHAKKVSDDLKSQANEWGTLDEDELKAQRTAEDAADMTINSSERSLKDIFIDLAIQSGMKVSNDLPKEEDCTAMAAIFTAKSCVSAMSDTKGLMPQLFKVVISIYSNASTVSENHATVVVDEAYRKANLAFEAIKTVSSLLPKEDTDKHLEELCTALLSLVIGRKVPSFSLELTCLADLIDCLVLNSSDSALDTCLNVFLPIIAMHPDQSKNTNAENNSKMVARSLQRRAYRLLRHALKRLADRTTEIPTPAMLSDVWTKLSDSLPSCHASALGARMQCLETFLTLANRSMGAYGIPMFSEFRKQVSMTVTKEVVTRAWEVSKDVRRGALAVLQELCVLCGDVIEDLTKLLLIGLAGDSKTTKPATLVCLARVLSQHATRMHESFATQIADTGLMLLRDREKATLREAIRFALVVVRIFPSDHIKNRLNVFLELINNPASPQVRLRVRRLIDRLILKVGAPAIDEVMPESHKALLLYVLRAQRRKARKAAKGGKRATIAGEIESDEESSSESSDGENARRRHQAFGLGTVTGDSKLSDLSSLDMDEKEGVKSVRWGQPAAAKKVQNRRDLNEDNELSDADLIDSDDEERQEMMRSRAVYIHKAGQKRKTDGTWLLEREGEALDLADANITAANILSKRTKNIRDSENANGDDDVTYGEDGKIHVRDAAAEALRASKSKESRLEAMAMERLKQLKTQRSEQKAGQREAAKNTEKSKKHEIQLAKRRVGHFSVHAPSDSKARRAGGDVVKKNSNVAPVAYMKLNPMLMKEKYVGQSTKSLEHLIQKKKGKK